MNVFLCIILSFSTIQPMKRQHQKTLALIFDRPVSANIKWTAIEALMRALGATIENRQGSRVSIDLFGVDRIYHRPHPSPNTDRGAVASIRAWLEQNGVMP